ncbi:MAG: cation diffusion facilitator family transporter [Nocardioidaceae bacterium]|nr:cation diffusion facilitator family transporter [Nocardioidaceae bacterium]
MSTEGSTKAVIAALLANTGIAVTKFLAWILTGASSLLAEAIHSVADAGNQGLLLIGSKRASREPTEQHPFGFGRERYIYAFIVSIVLFSVGGLFALYEAYHKYQELADDHGGESLLTSQWKWVPIVVLLAAIVMESFSFRTAIVESNKTRGDASWKEFIRRAKAPELPVVLLEDLAALLGLVFALVGVGVSLITGDLLWDVLGTTAIGLLLVVVAITLAIETKSLLLGESAAPEARALIEQGILGDDTVERIIHMRTLHVGPEEILVAAKIAVAPTESAQVLSDTINSAEERVRAAVPAAMHIYIEPDIYRP